MVDAMHAGADDYLIKPFDESELKARMLVGKRTLDLQEELVAARESMRLGTPSPDAAGTTSSDLSEWGALVNIFKTFIL